MSEEFDLPPGFGNPSKIGGSFRILKDLVGESENRLRRLHAPIEEVIESVTASLGALPSDCEDTLPWWETLLDEGTRYIEDLLGMAFTSAQTQINAVLANVRYLNLSRGRTEAKDLLDRGHKLPNSVPAIKFANAVANFWKHRDQWDAKAWSRLEADVVEEGKTVQDRTIDCLRRSGVTASSTGQIRQLASFFGIANYADLDPLRKAVYYWGHDLVWEIEQDLV